MGLSIIVIGYNSENTLPECIGSLHLFARQNSQINIEVIYVDSSSSDSSVAVAKQALVALELPWKIVGIQSAYRSAALGRRIGMQIANHSDILFVDSDMVVNTTWLKDALVRRDYRILSGQRYEVHLDGKICWISDRNYYKAPDLGEVNRPGGFFVLFDADKTCARFTPFLRSEEEADFVAQDAQLHDSIYRTETVAFVHLNRKPPNLLRRLYGNLRNMSAMSNYISARLNAIGNGYYLMLLKSSYFYEVGAICSLIFYSGVFTSRLNLVAYSFFIAVLFKRRMSILYRSIVFPFELILGILHFLTKRNLFIVEYSILFTGGIPVIPPADKGARK